MLLFISQILYALTFLFFSFFFLFVFLTFFIHLFFVYSLPLVKSYHKTWFGSDYGAFVFTGLVKHTNHNGSEWMFEETRVKACFDPFTPPYGGGIVLQDPANLRRGEQNCSSLHRSKTRLSHSLDGDNTLDLA